MQIQYAILHTYSSKLTFLKNQIGITESKFVNPYYTGLNGFMERWPHLKNYGEKSLFNAYNLRITEDGQHTSLGTSTSKAAVIRRLEKPIENSPVFRMTDTLSRRKNEYIFDTLKVNVIKGIVPKKKSLKLFKEVLGLKHIPKNQWRNCIVDYITETEKFIIGNTIRYEDVKIPYSWYVANKPTDDDVSLENPLGIDKNTTYIVNKEYQYTGTGSRNKFTLKYMEEEFLRKRHHELALMISSKWSAHRGYRIAQFLPSNIRIISVSKTNKELLKQLDNYYDMDKLAKRSNKFLGKVATSIIINQMFRKVMLQSRRLNVTDNRVNIYLDKIQILVPEWENMILNVENASNKFKGSRHSQFIQDLNEDGLSQDIKEVWVSIVNMAITHRTLNYDAIIDAEFICKTYQRYGKLIQGNADLHVHQLVALDISYSRKRILPFVYYRSFREQVNLENRSPSTCSGLGLAASLIHQYYNRTK